MLKVDNGEMKTYLKPGEYINMRGRIGRLDQASPHEKGNLEESVLHVFGITYIARVHVFWPRFSGNQYDLVEYHV